MSSIESGDKLYRLRVAMSGGFYFTLTDAADKKERRHVKWMEGIKEVMQSEQDVKLTRKGAKKKDERGEGDVGGWVKRSALCV